MSDRTEAETWREAANVLRRVVGSGNTDRHILIRDIADHFDLRAVVADQKQEQSHAMAETVNHPPHYAQLNPEPIDVIEAWGLGFCLGNAVKYIARAGKKGSTIEDLKKARWYIDRAIAKQETPEPTEHSR